MSFSLKMFPSHKNLESVLNSNSEERRQLGGISQNAHTNYITSDFVLVSSNEIQILSF